MLQQESLQRPVLLGRSQLRGVAGCHAQYMTNMGAQPAQFCHSPVPNHFPTQVLARLRPRVAHSHPPCHPLRLVGRSVHFGPWHCLFAGSIASLVLSVVIRSADSLDPNAPTREKLWGLCVCHHRTARYVPYAIRSAAEFLTQVFSLQLASAVEVRPDATRAATPFCLIFAHLRSTWFALHTKTATADPILTKECVFYPLCQLTPKFFQHRLINHPVPRAIGLLQ